MNEYNTYPTYPAGKSIWSTKMVTAVCAIVVMAVVIITGLVFMITSGAFDNSQPVAQDASFDAPILVITNCPNSVNSNNPTFLTEGLIVSDTGPCTLYINNERVASTSKAGEQVKWSKSYYLSSGETRQLVFVVADLNGIKTTETREVFCQSLQNIPKYVSKPITPGCNLVKKKAGGLNIREYPGTAYEVVDFIPSYDYTSSMVFTGNYRIAYDGYTWYEVISPKGKHGYVRSDLVANYEYVN